MCLGPVLINFQYADSTYKVGYRTKAAKKMILLLLLLVETKLTRFTAPEVNNGALNF